MLDFPIADLSMDMMDGSMRVNPSPDKKSKRDPAEFLDTFAAVRKRLTAHASQGYAELGVGSLQARFVRHIGSVGKASQAELARATDSDPTLTSRTLKTLIDRGLVEKERSDDDRREYVLELTATGKRLRERIERVRGQLAAKAIASLDAQDLADFDRIAKKILAAL
jgi:DNA-binding MarR family transcriptional regulator